MQTLGFNEEKKRKKKKKKKRSRPYAMNISREAGELKQTEFDIPYPHI